MELSDAQTRALIDLLDKQAITENMQRYCRGVDRFDLELLQSVYWAEATDDHGQYNGSAHIFAEWVCNKKQIYDALFHLTSPSHVELLGDQARVETYFLCMIRYNDRYAQGASDYMIGGRYKDLCEKRNGDWKILRRTVLWDWDVDQKTLSNWQRINMPHDKNFGRPKPDDQIYSQW